jgi:hypothetical protein
VSPELCESIQFFRNRLQRMPKRELIVLDEVSMRTNEAPLTTLVANNHQPIIEVADNTTYAHRYDMIAAISPNGVLPCIIYSPADRAELGVKGITTEMLLQFISSILAQACGALDIYPLHLVCDRAPIHNVSKMMECFNDNGCQEMKEIILMPPKAAKRMSPLDNCVFHYWKENVRAGGKLTDKNIRQRMNDAWNKLDNQIIYNYYKHCGLMPSAHKHFDCPQPYSHSH